jgi:hypothetical protein
MLDIDTPSHHPPLSKIPQYRRRLGGECLLIEVGLLPKRDFRLAGFGMVREGHASRKQNKEITRSLVIWSPGLPTTRSISFIFITSRSTCPGPSFGITAVSWNRSQLLPTHPPPSFLGRPKLRGEVFRLFCESFFLNFWV